MSEPYLHTFHRHGVADDDLPKNPLVVCFGGVAGAGLDAAIVAHTGIEPITAPSSPLFIQLADDLSSVPWSHGSNDVFRGSFNNVDFAVKSVRRTRRHVHFGSNPQGKMESDFFREAEVWKAISHPNVLPFVALAEIPGSSTPALVSPWMENGNLKDWIRVNPAADRLKMMQSVALGMSYLHENGIVHGNVHAANVLVDYEGNPKLADFGLSNIIPPDVEADGMGNLGRVRWQAPELVLGEVPSPTKACDVYSFACLAYYVFSGMQPYYHLEMSVDVVLAVYHMKLPFLRENKRFFDPPNADKGFWDLMLSCWSHIPKERPEIGNLYHTLITLQGLAADLPLQSHL